jgi:hypothetical protein
MAKSEKYQSIKDLELLKGIENPQEELTLLRKLVVIRSGISGITKDSESYNYKYISGDQILNKIKDAMDYLGVVLIPKLNDINRESLEFEVEKKNKNGESYMAIKREFIVDGNLTYVWINAYNKDDTYEVPWYLVGMQSDDPSKAFGTGLTYSERYFILKFFNIATDEDDPDNKKQSKTISHYKHTNKSYKNKSNNTGNETITDAQLWRLQEDMKTLDITWSTSGLKDKYGDMKKLTKVTASDLIGKLQQRIESGDKSVKDKISETKREVEDYEQQTR